VFLIFAPSLGVYYLLSLTLSVCMSVCLSQTLILLFCFVSPFFGHQFSMTKTTKRCSSIFDLGPLMPKIYSPKLLAIMLHYHVVTRGRALGTAALPGESWQSAELWADRCCHGNEIWARRGDPVAYRLVLIVPCRFLLTLLSVFHSAMQLNLYHFIECMKVV